MVELAPDHWATDGYKAEVLISNDTLIYLQKINEVIMPSEQLYFKSLTVCRYDYETGEEL